MAAETCAYMAIVHPDYTKLANRVTVRSLHKKTKECMLEVATQLHDYRDAQGRPAPLLCDEVYEVI